MSEEMWGVAVGLVISVLGLSTLELRWGNWLRRLAVKPGRYESPEGGRIVERPQCRYFWRWRHLPEGWEWE